MLRRSARSPLRRRTAIATGAAALLLATVGATAIPAVAAPVRPTTSTRTTTSLAQRRFDAMTPAERVGQLLMIGCPSTSVSASCLQIIRAQHVGSVILDGNSTLSIAATHRITAGLQHAAPRGTQLLIATDQEGGEVRRLRGPGFTDYSTALVQGTWSTPVLQHWATTWGSQLRRAGVGLDLAPVLDTVRKGDTHNPPIGAFDREYGHTPSVVATKGVAVLRGLVAGGVSTAVKHFPGLGRVTGNTDTTAHVTDRTTTAHDADLQPFRAAIRAKTAFVMMSSATYTRIDAQHPAAFSRTVVTGLLRTKLGFPGVIVSDDLGQAVQVASVPVGQRAVRFIGAGGDLVLTVVPSQAKAMESAVLARMRTSPSFTKQVDAAALLVLQQKERQGLLR
ncbi:glycoside hydrolase family 3 N-terminal domain-containing protein [Amnibacterium kyonggiense]|uniref:beta-N-acetylhexosaminidase n=1 Tax=Amnibacterium kyonggiense TaxID=595671 RepID=A0A4R7FKM2_9MICO|nr:glycoside hydrolase family 3 N-terminal domain-containing protein [Amnibacterium kyonggiense]TDS76906.1 beta-N-acetylhexosaminidase [Amnibacterium kyonggiense]